MQLSFREVMLATIVLALLAAVALPFTQVVRYEATISACQANLMAIHGVMVQYAANNNGRFPPCDMYYGYYFYDAVNNEGFPAVEELKSYGADAEMFFCPFCPGYGTDAYPMTTWEHPYIYSSSGTSQERVYVGYTFFTNRYNPYGFGVFTDGRALPLHLYDPGNLPMAADTLHARTSLQLTFGWYHGGGATEGGLFNSGGNTLFLGGYVTYMDWPALEAQGPGFTIGAANDMWWFPLDRANTVEVALDGDWAYQNAPLSTDERHSRVLAFDVTADPHQNSTYDIHITADPEDAVTIDLEGDPPVCIVRAGLNGEAPTGEVRIHVVAEGVEHGGFGSATATLLVRPLGDVTGDGIVNAEDKFAINQQLNGLVPPYTAAELDLDGDGAVGAQDKLIINQRLNGLAIP